jgi:type IV fimbrial biogenesis protein FimT
MKDTGMKNGWPTVFGVQPPFGTRVLTTPGSLLAARAHAGFTIIELMMTIMVLAILAAIALPDLSALIKNNRLETALGEVQYGLTYARSEAVTRTQNITVCPTTDGANCNGANWQDGLLVFVDANPPAGTVSSTSEILKHVQFGASGLRIQDLGNRFLSFNPSGRAMNGDTLTFCDTRTGAYGRQLQLFVVGRTESTRQIDCTS